MTADTQKQTARIYQFPAKQRAIGRTAAHNVPSMADKRAPATTDFGSGWYHDVAIQDAAASPHAG